MVSMDPKSGLLAFSGRREVQDVAEPNLLREMFPYSDVPRMIFDGQSVPVEPAKDICNALLDYAAKRDEVLRQAGEQYRIDDKTVFIIKRY